jgi:general secretion pathway protein D
MSTACPLSPPARRSALALLFLLTSCAEPGQTVTTEETTVTTTRPALPETNRPVELQRFKEAGNPATGAMGGTIYPGSGKLYAPVSGSSGVTKGPSEGDVSLNFVNVDVKEVAKGILGDLLGLNYIVDAAVQGTITVQTNQPIARTDILPTFQTVLRMNGLALVQQSGFYSIVPYGAAGKAVGFGARDAGYGTEIIALRYVGPDQMRRVLDPILPQGAILQADQARNLLIIGGTEGERAAIRERIATFDVDWLRGMSFALFTPRYATAKQMVDDLTHIMGDENSPMAGQVKLVAIDRMNAVLAISAQPRYLDDLRTWVTRLDRGNESTDRKIFIYYVQNGRAGDLAGVLGKALGIRTNAGQSDQASRSSNTQVGGAGASGQGGSGQFQSSFSPSAAQALGSQGFGSQGFGGSMMNPRPQSASALGPEAELRQPLTGGNGQDSQQVGGMSITADEQNNALLVVATPAEYEVIEAALRRLDILPLQVLIEAAIVEVTLTKDLNFGIQWEFKNGPNQLTLSGGATGAIAQSFPGFSYLYSSGTRISAILSALQDHTNINVLSAPKLMVLNNQTATLEVGDQVPIATQSAVSTLTTDASVVNSIEYKDTGVILTVTPRVNEGGLVLMDISQEVSDVAATTSSTLNSPTINERKIGSTVAVQDGQTIALGGLILDNRTVGASGVPYLQDIPVLGNLFKQNTSTSTRTELLVLITPRVVRDGRDAAAITAELQDKLLGLRDELKPIRGRTSAARNSEE